jgi:hypothetical protein
VDANLKKLPKLGEILRREWVNQGIDINSGVSESELRAFEETYNVALPHDVRDYFLTVNGMDRESTDDALIRFWTLAEVAPISQAAPEFANPSYLEDGELFFLFADFSLWTHAYAIRMEQRETESNEVLIIGNESPRLLSSSFTEFVERYLTNRKSVC